MSELTALIADDEPLLRDTLRQMLAIAWPALRIVGEARNGREAVELFEAHRPAICFLDIHMPGLSGVEAAQKIGRRAHLVFVTAFNQYALEAFDSGALDYLVKPVSPARLAETVVRLKDRLHTNQPALTTDQLLAQLAQRLKQPAALVDDKTGAQPLRYIRAAVGNTLRLIMVDDIDYLKSDDKYTVVAWRGDDGKPAEALIRVPLKDLADQLDPNLFSQVHRSVLVNLKSIKHVVRGDNETADIHLKNRPETLRVSRTYLHLFRQM
jgi:DNA-binding LytR/AlgR family response regulator